jgi:hypothetical protein
LGLHGIEADRRYLVTVSEGYRANEATRMSGTTLAALVATIPEQKGSVLVEYATESD